MSGALGSRAKDLHAKAGNLLLEYKDLRSQLLVAREVAVNGRDVRGLLQIAVDSYQEAEETTSDICDLLDDALEMSRNLLQELGEI